METRTLGNPLLHGADQGKVRMWVDILPKTGPLRTPVDISPRKPDDMELRVIVLDCKDVILEDKAITGQRMTDMFVRCYMRGLEDKKRDTDVHYRSLNGEGMFNWRMIFPFQFLRGEDVVVVEKRSSIFHLDKETRKLPPTLVVQVWDNDIWTPDDYIGETTIRLDCVDPAPGRKWRVGSRKNKKISLFKAQGSPPVIKGWFDMRRGGDEEQDGEIVGRVQLQIEILGADVAKDQPAGEGREVEPRPTDPVHRPATSFPFWSSPWKSFRYILWTNYWHWFLLLIFLAIVGVLLYYFFTEMPSEKGREIIQGK